MSLIADTLEAFYDFQKALQMGMEVIQLNEGYIFRYDEYSGRKRYSYAKRVNGEVQALATFGQEDPINGVDCYSVNYSVGKKHRRRGLAVEVVNTGIEELRKEFSRLKIKCFYVDAMIAETNINSIKVAKKLFPRPGIPKSDLFSGTPSLYFNKLIELPCCHCQSKYYPKTSCSADSCLNI